MRAFNIKQAIAGAPVQTRDGDPVFDLSKDGPSLRGTVSGIERRWKDNGRYTYYEDNHPRDLFMAPKSTKKAARACHS